MLLSLSHSFHSLTFHQSLCNIQSYLQTFLINLWQKHSDFKGWPQTSLGRECAVNMCGYPVISLKYVICIDYVLVGLKSSSLETCSASTIRIYVYTHVHVQTHKTHTHAVCLLLLSVGLVGNPPSTSAFEVVCTLHLTPLFFSPPIHLQRCQMAKGGMMGEKWPVKFSQTIWLPRNCWVL
jgi:hypothetical protein